MYAIFTATPGGKQHRAEVGKIVKLDKIELGIGETIEFDQVLLVANGDNIQVGAPILAGHKVVAEVVEQDRDDKIRVIKFRRRKHHMKHQGHRQYFTAVKITQI